MAKITIGEFTKQWFFLSNFFPSPFFAAGRTWATVEHFFQAMKSVDEGFRDEVAAQTTPGKAKRLGRIVTLRDDWEEIKDAVMLCGVRHKFRLVQGLDRMLLSTGAADLVEGNRHGDAVWGFDLKKNIGENRLGRILVSVRAELALPAMARIQFYGERRTFLGDTLWKSPSLEPTGIPVLRSLPFADLANKAGISGQVNALVMPDNGSEPLWLAA